MIYFALVMFPVTVNVDRYLWTMNWFRVQDLGLNEHQNSMNLL